MAVPALAVIDYGGGNLGSLVAALDRRSVAYSVTSDAAAVALADAAIFPGDGAFGATMDALRERGLDDAIHALVRAGRPFLGICVGMQVLYDESDEFGGSAGLGILRGHVRRFTGTPRVPHMGWNDLTMSAGHPFTAGVADGSYAYFLHSYRVEPDAATIATCDYGGRFAAITAHGNVMATQFHPEKSRRTGARLIDNFLALAAGA